MKISNVCVCVCGHHQYSYVTCVLCGAGGVSLFQKTKNLCTRQTSGQSNGEKKRAKQKREKRKYETVRKMWRQQCKRHEKKLLQIKSKLFNTTMVADGGVVSQRSARLNSHIAVFCTAFMPWVGNNSKESKNKTNETRGSCSSFE